jgi:hypothetical protein
VQSADDLTPLTGADVGVALRNLAQQRDGEGDHQLGDGAAVDAAGPAQRDLAGLHRMQVDLVEADAVLGDHLEFGQCIEDAGVDRLKRNDGPLMALQIRDQLVSAEADTGIVERGVGIACAQLGAEQRMA